MNKQTVYFTDFAICRPHIVIIYKLNGLKPLSTQIIDLSGKWSQLIFQLHFQTITNQ
jgi:hypothetical protein